MQKEEKQKKIEAVLGSLRLLLEADMIELDSIRPVFKKPRKQRASTKDESPESVTSK